MDAFTLKNPDLQVSLHIATPRRLDPLSEGMAANSPRHSIRMLAEQVGATMHAPATELPSLGDRIRSLCLQDAGQWAFASTLRRKIPVDGHVLCTGEVPGFHIAALLGGHSRSPEISVMVHNVIRPRAKAAMKLWSLHKRVSNFIAVSAPQIDFLRGSVGIDSARTHFLWDHTDTRFFSPGASGPKKRPLIVSIGLEQRDYVTLAEATRNMDVDVRISGFSKDSTASSKAFPEQLPANMSRGYYSWPDLVQLYRDADVVVVSTFSCTYAAGVQGLMEAMSCGRPVVVTATQGLAKYIDSGAATAVEPQNPRAMRDAITAVLQDPVAAAQMGTNGRRIACERHSMESYVAGLKAILV